MEMRQSLISIAFYVLLPVSDLDDDELVSVARLCNANSYVSDDEVFVATVNDVVLIVQRLVEEACHCDPYSRRSSFDLVEHAVHANNLQAADEIVYFWWASIVQPLFPRPTYPSALSLERLCP